MTTEERLRVLQNLGFLHGFSEDFLKPLAEIATVERVPAGTVIFREGQRHNRIYFIVEGSMALELRVSNQLTKRLQTIGPGELLGWSPTLGENQMTATARALQSTTLVAVEGAQLAALCEHNLRFGMEFMKRTAQALARRLSATRLQLLDIYQHELPSHPENLE
jgi:CRP-like cAMP-binding protein